ncbi:hypothetical protein [Allokutzneria oryzae]|uniref:Uncharacterized protein n=1 Tax=Allokutzneria oryzae TaxID=1378989 RepID=A0ABV5ZZE9_9PSEU
MSSILKSLTDKAAAKTKTKLTSFFKRNKCVVGRCSRRLRKISRTAGYGLTCGRYECEMWLYSADPGEVAKLLGVDAKDVPQVIEAAA